MWSMTNKAMLRVYMLWKKIVWTNMTSNFYLQTSFQVIAHPLTIGTLCLKFEQDKTKGEEKICSGQGFFLIFCYELQFWSRNIHVVQCHYTRILLCVKYELYLAKRREDMFRTRDRWTDGQNEHRRAPTELGPNYFKRHQL